MGYFLYYFTVVASFFLILVISLSISSFLYLLSEVCEEYPFKVKYIIQNIFIVLLILHVLLLADDFSRIYSRIFLSLICLCLYYISFQKYPFIKIISLESMLSAIAFILSNITWFNYFSSNIYDFNFFQIVGFMLIIVWYYLIPSLIYSFTYLFFLQGSYRCYYLYH